MLIFIVIELFLFFFIKEFDKTTAVEILSLLFALSRVRDFEVFFFKFFKNPSNVNSQ